MSLTIPEEGLKVNLGCGRHTLDGWFCIDKAQHPEASRPVDLISDVCKIDLPDQCAVVLQAIHLWEHLYPWECEVMITEWKRLLRPGGKLILEMPDLLKTCTNILSGRDDGRHPGQLGMWGLYGDPRTKDPLMMHRWAWTYKTLRKFLVGYGFVHIVESETKWHPMGRGKRDFRVEAVRGEVV